MKGSDALIIGGVALGALYLMKQQPQAAQTTEGLGLGDLTGLFGLLALNKDSGSPIIFNAPESGTGITDALKDLLGGLTKGGGITDLTELTDLLKNLGGLNLGGLGIDDIPGLADLLSGLTGNFDFTGFGDILQDLKDRLAGLEEQLKEKNKIPDVTENLNEGKPFKELSQDGINLKHILVKAGIYAPAIGALPWAPGILGGVLSADITATFFEKIFKGTASRLNPANWFDLGGLWQGSGLGRLKDLIPKLQNQTERQGVGLSLDKQAAYQVSLTGYSPESPSPIRKDNIVSPSPSPPPPPPPPPPSRKGNIWV